MAPNRGAGSRDLNLQVSEMFSSWEEDFERHVGQARKYSKLLENQASAPLDIKRGRDAVRDASNCLKQMEVEVKTLPPGSSEALKVRRLRKEFAEVSAKFEKAEAKAARGGLLSGASGGMRGEGGGDGLMDATRQMEAGTRSLESSRRSAQESEELSLGILSQLHGQREQILRTKGTLHDTGSTMDTARRILVSMHRRVLTNRIVLWTMVFLLLFANLAVVYFKMLGKL
uniref:t-SNARE coiled-coil homology domain-containing protein n=1 Tax=Chromera velia CCMP2878 TaxID=1169474 RepID=A0A0G4G644_9ALVE|eukprot:Cvel_20445.t1-p1 / transcript=Cvel_20445.t1 / gene=Cvel_20445 / organism=Chromera_velia_CCMP2878 / gene_product=hypothetical protein / transcript_product=hypothetical protein / location=Cvel_scaffold1833:31213-35229(+) / protein_length=228 / sequence_SO=supercontig / SO=protein_coding / is_pseudo=false